MTRRNTFAAEPYPASEAGQAVTGRSADVRKRPDPHNLESRANAVVEAMVVATSAEAIGEAVSRAVAGRSATATSEIMDATARRDGTHFESARPDPACAAVAGGSMTPPPVTMCCASQAGRGKLIPAGAGAITNEAAIGSFDDHPVPTIAMLYRIGARADGEPKRFATAFSAVSPWWASNSRPSFLSWLAEVGPDPAGGGVARPGQAITSMLQE